MAHIKKHGYLFFAIVLISVYFITRLYNILDLPIFTDEAIYIRWAQIALNDPAWRFISLTDGKQPSFIWLSMFFLRLIEDPLLAGRLVSTAAGLFTGIGIFALTRELFKNRNIAFIAVGIYILFPFALVYDRIALYDSLMAAVMIWALYLEIMLARYVRLDLALILGAVIGAGLLTKSIAQFAIILLPFSLLVFDFSKKDLRKRLTRWGVYAFISAIIAGVINLILRLSPFYYIIEQKNYLFIYRFDEWIANPFVSLFSNLSAFEDWLISYATLPFLVLVIAAFVITGRHYKEKLLIYVWFLFPMLSTAFFGRLVYPRFLLFMTIPLITLGAYSLYNLVLRVKPLWIKSLIVVFSILMFVVSDFYILTDFKNAPIPQADRGQFYTGWPSGVGVRESIEFFEKEASKQKIFIGTQGTFGLLPYALEIYLKDNPNVEIAGFWPIDNEPPDEALAKAKKMPVYFVFYQECPSCKYIGQAPISWPLEQIMQIEKVENNNYYTIYRLDTK